MTVGELLRQGAVTEIVGPLCSGRTSLLVACLGEVGRAGGAAALIDADDAFDPASAARAGVDLDRVLWVRCGGRPGAPAPAAPPVSPPPRLSPRARAAGGSPPPRSPAPAPPPRRAGRPPGAAPSLRPRG